MTAEPLPKILCVDDEPNLLQALERQLRRHFTVLSAGSAREALEVLTLHADAAVILSDFHMAGADGLSFLREVRRLCPLATRAIVSGQMDLPRISDAINRADIHKFILKPWDGEYLLVQMLEALGIHHALRERAHFEKLALTDPVTRVGNHRAFQEALRTELARGTGSLALVMFDVDNFKSFNDRFGHPRGDELLRHMADHLVEATGNTGHVARYGGEEFTVILPGCDRARARTFAEEVRARCASDVKLTTVSAGLALHPEDARTAADLIARADEALYRAKAGGRNRVVSTATG